MAAKNRNIVLYLVIIWAVAVFGFQILLRLVEKPSPEKNLISFQEVWPSVEQESADVEETQIFLRSILAVLGKPVKPDHRLVFENALSSSLCSIIPYNDLVKVDRLSHQVSLSRERLKELNKAEFEAENINYLNYKVQLSELLAPYAGVPPASNSGQLLSYDFRPELCKEFTSESKAQLPELMELYMTHNQSFLTDTQFLGFPFHYFYTAVFLLILFVFLCWLYCIRIGSLQKRFGIED